MIFLKTPITCFLILLYMGWYYHRQKHPKLKTTRIFHILYCIAVINMVFDGITVYGVNHLDTFPPVLNYISHVIFLLSINWAVFYLFLYILAYTENVTKISEKLKKIYWVPVLLTSVLIILLPISYIVTEHGAYSLGPKAYALYASAVCYIFLILYYNLKYWKLLNKEKRIAILLSAGIFIIASIAQMLIPEILITAIAIALVVIGLFMSNENPEEYIEKQSGIFNAYAFYAMTGEAFHSKKPFYVLHINIEEIYLDDTPANRTFYYRFYRELDHYVQQKFRQTCYRVTDNGLTILTLDAAAAESKKTHLQEKLQQSLEMDGAVAKAIAQVECFSCPNDAKDYQELMQRISAVSTASIKNMAFYDTLTGAKNRNAFNRDLQYLIYQPDEKLWYVLVDANNLKTVNDTFGHVYGDELLCSVVKILENAGRETQQIYRIGGDEFAFIWKEKPDNTIEEFVKNIYTYADQFNQDRPIKVQFALGYSLLYQDCDLEAVMAEADSMMYENKIAMKGNRR